MIKIFTSQPKGFGYGRIGMSENRSYEDRHFWGNIKTKSELDFSVGIVADGVGGGSFGERAAQITVDVIKNSILNTMETDLIQIMGKAIGAANRAVHVEAQENPDKRGMSSTVVVAIIFENKLYIANVGDSRVYLIRDNELVQLTIDHTWANDKIRAGVLDSERANNHFNADAITRSIGFKADVIVDFGLYMQGGTESVKQASLQQGLELTDDDVVLLCSDGLIKHSPRGLKRRYVSDKAILDVVGSEHAKQIAKVLVDTAVGNNVDDNTTALVMELSGRKLEFFDRNKTMLKWLGGVVGLALALLITLVISGNLRGEVKTLHASSTAFFVTQEAITQQALSLPATPIPTNVSRKTTEIGTVTNEKNNTSILTDRMLLEAEGFTFASLTTYDGGNDGEIYLDNGSRIVFESNPVRTLEFVVFDNSHLMVDAGGFGSGTKIHIEGSFVKMNLQMTSDSLMLIEYEGFVLKASCLIGHCYYQMDAEGLMEILNGHQVWIDVTDKTVDAHKIANEDLFYWNNQVLEDSFAGVVLREILP